MLAKSRSLGGNDPEVKVPTARNELIGTRKTDYAVYGIATRRFGPDGRFDAHANVSYTLVGRPRGVGTRICAGYRSPARSSARSATTTSTPRCCGSATPGASAERLARGH